MTFQFQPFTPDLASPWDDFVAANPHAWPGHDRAIVEFERLRGGRSVSHLVLDESGRIIGVAPLFLGEYRQARLFRIRTLHSGSSLRGGALLAADLPASVRRRFWPALKDVLVTLARRERVDEIHIAFPHLWGDRPKEEMDDYFPLLDFGFRDGGVQSLIMDLTGAPADLTERFTREGRKNVRHALREGAAFEPIEDRAAWLACDALNRETFRDEPFPAYSRESLEQLWDGFVARGLARVFRVRYEGEPVSVLVTAGTATSHYGWIGFNRRPLPVRGANNLLVKGAMDWLRERGVRYYEIGSLEFDDPRQRRIAAFKRSFGAETRPAWGGCLVVSEIRKAAAELTGALARRLRGRSVGVPDSTEEDD